MTVQTASAGCAPSAARYIAGELPLGVIINIAMAGGVTALVNHAEAFNGASLGYVASDLAMATLLPILSFGICLTLVTRKRLASGALAPLATPALAWAPHSLLLRMALLVAVGLVVLGAPAALALHALGSANALTPLRLMLFKLAYGALIGIVGTPVVVALALQDRPATPRP